jgi:hypothetical protein
MELAAKVSSIVELDEQIELEITKLQGAINQLPELRKEGSASGWAEINRSATLAMQIIADRGAGVHVGVRQAEVDLQSKDGCLVGRPDYFSIAGDVARLREYKSGAIREPSGQPISVYADQVKFYAALIFDNYAVARVVASIESLNGDACEFEMKHADAAQFASAVACALRDANSMIGEKRDVSDLARPSKGACSFCEARIICVRFKREQDRLDLEGDQFLIEGMVTNRVQAANGAVTALTIMDEYRKMIATIVVPREAVVEVPGRGKLLLLNVRRHGGTLEWGRTSRAFRCE